MIQKTLGPEVKIFDGGAGTAREMKRRLKEAALLNDSVSKGKVVFGNSLQDDRKLELAKKLFEMKTGEA